MLLTYSGFGGSLASNVPSLRTLPPLSSASESVSESSNVGSGAFLSTGGPAHRSIAGFIFCLLLLLLFYCVVRGKGIDTDKVTKNRLIYSVNIKFKCTHIFLTSIVSTYICCRLYCVIMKKYLYSYLWERKIYQKI